MPVLAYLYAALLVDFDKDGTFNVWEVNQDALIRERTPD